MRNKNVRFLSLTGWMVMESGHRSRALRAVVLGAALAVGTAAAAPVDGDPLYRGQRSLGKVSRSLLEDGKAAADTLAHLRLGQPEIEISLSILTADVLARAAAAGLEVLDADHRHARILGVCRGDCLPALAAMPEVRAIHPNYGATTMAGNVVSQADTSIRAAAARQAHGLTGAGVRIGILSDTLTAQTSGNFEGTGCDRLYTSVNPKSAAELPEVVRVIAEPRDIPGATPTSNSDEGRAMAELIHDLAPGADLYFHTAFNTQSIFVRGIEALVDCGVDILVDDVIYFAEPMFQDGIVAQAANAAVEQGIPFFSAIGNLGPWGVDETYADANPEDDMASTPSGNDLHVFADGSSFARVMVPRGCVLRMVMQWNEPFSGTLGEGATTDLDLYACSAADPTSCGAGRAARDSQGCATGDGPSGDPMEILDVRNNTVNDEVVYIAIEHVCGNKDVRFRIASFSLGCFFPNRYEFDPDVFRHSPAYGHPVGAGVVGTAAVYYAEIDSAGDYQAPPGVINVEPFSSRGGNIPYYFDASGQPLPGAPLLRTTPFLSAPDGTNTSFFGLRDSENDGFRNFFGTSAAAPHAAAVAALILEANPLLAGAEVVDILQSTAIDIESLGPDRESGRGLIDAVYAIDEVYARLTPAPSATATPVPTLTPEPSPTRAAGCPGDCDGDGTVAITELITGVRIALGIGAIDDCESADVDRNGAVEINELIQTVLAALHGC